MYKLFEAMVTKVSDNQMEILRKEVLLLLSSVIWNDDLENIIPANFGFIGYF
jgi:hypothetical protein